MFVYPIVLQKQIADEEFPHLFCVRTSFLANEVFCFEIVCKVSAMFYVLV
jgi:hypothetical protein